MAMRVVMHPFIRVHRCLLKQRHLHGRTLALTTPTNRCLRNPWPDRMQGILGVVTMATVDSTGPAMSARRQGTIRLVVGLVERALLRTWHGAMPEMKDLPD